jgi:GT2 family glycosyltransferase
MSQANINLEYKYGKAEKPEEKTDEKKSLETTFVIPIIRHDFIERCLRSLYETTDSEIFRVIVIDQSPVGVYEKIKNWTHHYIRPYRNLGFAKAMNTGIRLVDTPYVSCFNDDIEFLNKRWWSGIKETFEAIGETCFAVNPMSPKEAAWGYGNKAPQGRVLSDDNRGVLWVTPDGKTVDLDYSKTEEGYDWLLQNVRGWIDGIVAWAPTFRMDLIDKIGMFDERFYPGGGEDYDLNARAYDPEYAGGRYRLVATSRSWVYHFWGSSGSPFASEETKEALKKQEIKFDDKLKWNNWTSLWQDAGHHPTVSKGRIGDVEKVDL